MLFWLAFKQIGPDMWQAQTSRIITFLITDEEAELHRIKIAWKKNQHFTLRTIIPCSFFVDWLTIFPIHSLSFWDSSPNGDASETSVRLAKLWTLSGTVQRTVQCWKSLACTSDWINPRVSLCSRVPTIKTAFVSDSFPP